MVYVLGFVRFSVKSMHLLQCLNEVCTAVVFVCCNLLVFESTQDYSNAVTDIVVYSVSITLGVNAVVSLVTGFLSLIRLCCRRRIENQVGDELKVFTGYNETRIARQIKSKSVQVVPIRESRRRKA